MLDFAISGVEAGQLNAAVKNIMRQMGITDAKEAVRRINSGEYIVSEVVRSWREQDGVTYFSVTPNGKTGSQWIDQFGEKNIGSYAKSVLRSDDFKPTNGITTEIAVLKGGILFKDSNRITKKIRAKAYAGTFTGGKKLFDPNAEVACLIREKFTNKEIEEMGLQWIITMHKPIEDSDGDPALLGAGRGDSGQLRACGGRPGKEWGRGGGFAFAVSQVSI